MLSDARRQACVAAEEALVGSRYEDLTALEDVGASMIEYEARDVISYLVNYLREAM